MVPHGFLLLAEAGFSLYERRALIALASLGVADAASLCRAGEIPTSKIYLAMEKLAGRGLCEIQPSRPKLYAALPDDLLVDRLNAIARARAEDFAARSAELKSELAALPRRLRGEHAFTDLAIGRESHVKRHLIRLGEARKEVVSYMEEGDIAAIGAEARQGFDIVKRVFRGLAERRIAHRAVFGFTDRTAPRLMEFLKRNAAELENLTGIRYSGELGHPFHVIDGVTVILSLDHPFIPDGRFASLLVRDETLAGSLTQGFETLWQRALKDLREVRAYPRRA